MALGWIIDTNIGVETADTDLYSTVLMAVISLFACHGLCRLPPLFYVMPGTFSHLMAMWNPTLSGKYGLLQNYTMYESYFQLFPI